MSTHKAVPTTIEETNDAMGGRLNLEIRRVTAPGIKTARKIAMKE